MPLLFKAAIVQALLLLRIALLLQARLLLALSISSSFLLSGTLAAGCWALLLIQARGFSGFELLRVGAPVARPLLVQALALGGFLLSGALDGLLLRRLLLVQGAGFSAAFC